MNSNHECIFKIQEDGLLQDGIHRYKVPSGDTWIGYRLFWRGDRQENKQFIFYKLNSSGEIRYLEQVWGKNDKDWRTVTDYKFHPETMSWSEIEY